MVLLDLFLYVINLVIIDCNFNHRLGVIDIAEQHMTRASPECKEDLSAKIQKVKGHLIRGGNARRNDNWKAALREVDAVIEEGADSSQSVIKFHTRINSVCVPFTPTQILY
jgi:hypothetical protein